MTAKEFAETYKGRRVWFVNAHGHRTNIGTITGDFNATTGCVGVDWDGIGKQLAQQAHMLSLADDETTPLKVGDLVIGTYPGAKPFTIARISGAAAFSKDETYDLLSELRLVKGDPAPPAPPAKESAAVALYKTADAMVARVLDDAITAISEVTDLRPAKSTLEKLHKAQQGLMRLKSGKGKATR